MCVRDCVCVRARASLCVYVCVKRAEIYSLYRKNKLHRFIFISLPTHPIATVKTWSM